MWHLLPPKFDKSLLILITPQYVNGHLSRNHSKKIHFGIRCGVGRFISYCCFAILRISHACFHDVSWSSQDSVVPIWPFHAQMYNASGFFSTRTLP